MRDMRIGVQRYICNGQCVIDKKFSFGQLLFHNSERFVSPFLLGLKFYPALFG